MNEEEIIQGDMCNKSAINWGRGATTTNHVVINTFAPASTDNMSSGRHSK